MSQNIQNILKDLVSFPVLGGQSNHSIKDYITGILNDKGVDFSLVPNEEESKASIHCRIGPPTDNGVILSGHMDVVPVKGQQWHTDPFVLEDTGDGNLYGRGSCDMKGFLACCLANIEFFQKKKLSRPIYFAFSYDEEIGCLGAPALIKDIQLTYKESPKYAIIGEPSLMQPIIGQKGICILKTTVNGSAGHSSRIKQEISAIHEAARLIIWLENKMNEFIEPDNIDNRFNPPHSSIHVGIVHGGIAPNVISDSCYFTWDVRVIPKNSIQNILYEYHQFCRLLEKKNNSIFDQFKIITEEIHPPVPPLDTNEKDEIIPMVTQHIENKNLGTVSYAAEAGQFSEAGFQSIICGPGSIAQAHRANEFIAKSELLKCDEFLKRLAISLQ
jgi:acetylornithine deacetylase